MAILNTGTAAPFTASASTPAPAANSAPTGSLIFLRVLLILLAVGAWGEGGSILANAKSAVHEIEAGLCFLTGAVFFSASAVLEGLRVIAKRLG